MSSPQQRTNKRQLQDANNERPIKRMKVKELREELALRGLPTVGKKPELLSRLNEFMRCSGGGFRGGAASSEDSSMMRSSSEPESQLFAIPATQVFAQCDENHSKRTLAGMHELQMGGLLCDFTLIAEDLEIKCHRSILAANSGYFKGCFLGNFSESQKSSMTITDLDFSTLQNFINYIYTGLIDLSEEKSLQYLEKAVFLQMDSLQMLICRFLLSRISPENCLPILEAAEIFGCDELAKDAKTFSVENFYDVSHRREFLELSEDRLVWYLGHTDLGVDSEDQVCKALLIWVRHKQPERQHRLPDLLKYVHLHHISPQYLTSVLAKDDLIVNNVKLTQELLILTGQRLHPDHVAKPMKRRGTFLVALFGGMDSRRKSMKAIRFFSVAQNQWGTKLSNLEEVPVMPENVHASIAISWGDKVFLFGGYKNSEDCAIRRVQELDITTFTWSCAPDMLQERREHAACLYKDMIYLSGGMKPSKEARKDCEVFNPRARVWKALKPMEFGRVRFGIGAIKGCLYACGGYDGKHNLKSVERLELGSDEAEWQQVSDMIIKRNGHTVVVYSDFLFVIGGYGGNESNNPLKQVERYDPETDTWKLMAPMLVPRQNASSTILGNKIYVFGGHKTKEERTDECEVYDIDSNRWYMLPKMNDAVSFASSSVIKAQLKI